MEKGGETLASLALLYPFVYIIHCMCEQGEEREVAIAITIARVGELTVVKKMVL